MSRVMRSTVVALLASACPMLLQAQAFEGVVNWQMTSDRGPMQMVQSYKGTQVRSEMAAQGQAMIMLMDATSPNMIMLMPAQKMYMTMDLKKMAGEHGIKPDSAAKITATGATETVAGHACDDYLVGAKQDIEVCAAKGMGFFQMASGGGPLGGRGGMGGMGDVSGAVSNPAYARMFTEGFFPLKVSKVSAGKKNVIMEATKIAPGAVDASLFKVPDGYTEMKM